MGSVNNKVLKVDLPKSFLSCIINEKKFSLGGFLSTVNIQTEESRASKKSVVCSTTNLNLARQIILNS